VAEPRQERSASSIPTAPRQTPRSRLRRARAMRRLSAVGLCLLLAAALLGRLGVRTGEVSGRGNGYELTLRFPETTRAGLAVRWEAEIRHAGGFSRVVTLAVDSSYLDLFDENGLDPDPVGATSDGERVIWSFEPPRDADTMTVSLDARIEPGVQLQRARGAAAVLEDGRTMTSVRFKTLVLP
jgi:hypothetical protein